MAFSTFGKFFQAKSQRKQASNKNSLQARALIIALKVDNS